MTTNHKEMLDPALIRPGRVDMEEYFGNAKQEQILDILRHFFPEVSKEQSDLFLRYIPDNKVSMAFLQGLFLIHKDNLPGLLHEAKKLAVNDDNNNIVAENVL